MLISTKTLADLLIAIEQEKFDAGFRHKDHFSSNLTLKSLAATFGIRILRVCVEESNKYSYLKTKMFQ